MRVRRRGTRMVNVVKTKAPKAVVFTQEDSVWVEGIHVRARPNIWARGAK